MARMETLPYAACSFSELNNPVVIVIDMINGFAKTGALADPAIAGCAAPIAALLDHCPERLFVTDCHEPGCMEFQAYPPHCLKGSKESEVIAELQDYADEVLEKNSINTFTAPGFDLWLAGRDNCDLILTGCCTDLCVLQLALSLQSWIHQNERKDLRVFVPANCVDTFQIDGVHEAAAANRFALDNMKSCGIQVVSELSF